MKLFVGLDFTEEIKETLFSIQQQTLPYVQKGNFQEKDNFHLTIRYLGEVDEQEETHVREALIATSSELSPFQLNINHLGTFPKGETLVFWAGVEKNHLLQKTYDHFAHHLTQLSSFEKETRRFSPHITFGQNIQFKADWDEKAIAREIAFPAFETTIHELTLFEIKKVNGNTQFLPIFKTSLS